MASKTAHRPTGPSAHRESPGSPPGQSEPAQDLFQLNRQRRTLYFGHTRITSQCLPPPTRTKYSSIARGRSGPEGKPVIKPSEGTWVILNPRMTGLIWNSNARKYLNDEYFNDFFSNTRANFLIRSVEPNTIRTTSKKVKKNWSWNSPERSDSRHKCAILKIQFY